jgi:hypothetical protein
MLARMRRPRLAVAGTITSLALAACGGGDGSGAATPDRLKPRTLTAADYPVMREFIVTEGTKVAELRPLCRSLDKAPGTAVVKAARDACDRVLSVAIDLADDKLDCDTGDRGCLVGYLRRKERQLKTLFDALTDFNGEVEAVLAPGPCRDALTQPDEIADGRRVMRDFKHAVDAFESGDNAALDDLPDSDDDDDEDPTPCRPKATA